MTIYSDLYDTATCPKCGDVTMEPTDDDICYDTMRCPRCGAELVDLFCPRCEALPGNAICDDHFFERFGDMLTPNELRRSELFHEQNRRFRDQYLATYERCGIGDDQDPGFFDVSVPTVDGDTVDTFCDRMIEVASDAIAMRFATPDDFHDIADDGDTPMGR